ncbi:DNA methyltransferase, partial [Streptococcus anginosus]
MRFIGSKANLIEEIEKIILEQTNGNEYTFLDLFAGTNCVGNYF